MNKREREMAVFRAVVLSYIAELQPVSSGSLARTRLSELALSSATIRSILADLEEEGLLEKPHFSAGRVPTEQGYRLFVRELMIARPPSADDRLKIDSMVGHSGGIDAAASTAVKLLTNLSHSAGILFLSDISEAAISKFHFIRVSGKRIQAVLITVHSHIHNIILDMEEEWDDSTLLEIANYLNGNHAGHTLRKIRDQLGKAVESGDRKAAFPETGALAIQEKLIEHLPEPELNVEGTANLLDVPEFKNDLGRLGSVMRAVNDRKLMLELVEKCINGGKLSVAIGSDLAPRGFDGCSLIASSFDRADGRCGVIGIMGPTRMDYPYLTGLVCYMAEAIKTGAEEK